MENILKTIEFYNGDYISNNLPKILSFNVENNMDTFVESAGDIFNNCQNKTLQRNWKAWEEIYRHHTSNDAFKCLYIHFSAGQQFRENIVYFIFNRKHINNVSITLLNNNETQRLNLKDVEVLNRLNGTVKKQYLETYYNIGEFTNIKGIDFTTINYSANAELRISYNLLERQKKCRE